MNLTDLCICGHERRAHIYYESACRPGGFSCSQGCRHFRDREQESKRRAEENPHPPSKGPWWVISGPVLNLANAVEALSLRVAVVRPTRDQIATVIAEAHSYKWAKGRVNSARPLIAREYWPAADAVLALFGVAVSDSQPVRRTSRYGRTQAVSDPELRARAWRLYFNTEPLRSALPGFVATPAAFAAMGDVHPLVRGFGVFGATYFTARVMRWLAG